MKVTMINSFFEERGAHEQARLLAKYCVEQGWTVSLITLRHSDEIPSLRLDQRIHCSSLGFGDHSKYGIQRMWKYARLLYRLRRRVRLQAPDVLISFSTISNVFTALATRGLGLPLVVSQQCDSSKLFEKPVWRRLRSWAYAASEAVVVPTSGIHRMLPPWVQKKTAVIPRLVALSFDRAITLPGKKKSSSPLAVGLFASQAESERIVRAFALSWQRHPYWRLTIVGDWPWKAELRVLCEQLGMAGVVEMPGEVHDVPSLLENADLFIHQSFQENEDTFSQDAMACGVAVLTIKGQGADGRVIRNWVNGVRVQSENVAELGQAISVLMSKEDVRRHLGSNARRSLQQLHTHKIVHVWHSLIGHVAHAHRDRKAAASA